MRHLQGYKHAFARTNGWRSSPFLVPPASDQLTASSLTGLSPLSSPLAFRVKLPRIGGGIATHY